MKRSRGNVCVMLGLYLLAVMLPASVNKDASVLTTSKRKRQPSEAKEYPVNRDCQQYRDRYPGLADSPENLDQNLRFYRNEIKSSPSPGGKIEEILARWPGNYALLERHHGYIQWLFPTREQGVNERAHALQLHEAQAISSCGVARTRVLAAYRMMLDFFGLSLADEHSGRLARLANFEARLAHLLDHPHNLLRITRIVRSLGELGWAHLQRPLVELYLDEVERASPDSSRGAGPGASPTAAARTRPAAARTRPAAARTRPAAGMRQLARSCLAYWVNSVLNERDWRELQARAAPLLSIWLT